MNITAIIPEGSLEMGKWVVFKLKLIVYVIKLDASNSKYDKQQSAQDNQTRL